MTDRLRSAADAIVNHSQLPSGLDPVGIDEVFQYNRSTVTLLELAISYNNVRAVAWLLDLGSDANQPFARTDWEYQPGTLLVYACYVNSARAALLLLRHTADVNKIDSKGKSALYYAIVNRHLGLMNAIAKRGGDIKYVANILESHRYNNYAIHSSVLFTLIQYPQTDTYDILEFIISFIEDINLYSKNHYYDKTYIIFNLVYWPNILKLLLDYGLDISMSYSYNQTVLEFAIEMGTADSIDIIIEHNIKQYVLKMLLVNADYLECMLDL